MSMIVVKTIRAMAATTLIAGSIYVQHVERAHQVGSKQVELQRGNSPGSEFAVYIIESSEPLRTLVR
jgi:hypothetical protein